jgi:hypothetical protein
MEYDWGYEYKFINARTQDELLTLLKTEDQQRWEAVSLETGTELTALMRRPIWCLRRGLFF